MTYKAILHKLQQLHDIFVAYDINCIIAHAGKTLGEKNPKIYFSVPNKDFNFTEYPAKTDLIIYLNPKTFNVCEHLTLEIDESIQFLESIGFYCITRSKIAKSIENFRRKFHWPSAGFINLDLARIDALMVSLVDEIHDKIKKGYDIFFSTTPPAISINHETTFEEISIKADLNAAN